LGKSRGGWCSKYWRIGVIHCHDASTASRRENSVASPRMASSSSRSYASGGSPPNAST
jgi:hypothetical protein